MKKVLLVLVLTLCMSLSGYSARTRSEGIRNKKAALERKYQKCMRYSRYKQNCQKYREIKNNIR